MKQSNILVIAILLIFAGISMASADADSTKHKAHNMKGHKMHSMKGDTSKMKNHDMKMMKHDSSKMMHKKDMKKAAKKKVDIWNAYCPISGEAVDPGTPTVKYQGKNIGFCCPGCDEKFMKDPKKYIKKLSKDGKKFVGKKESM